MKITTTSLTILSGAILLSGCSTAGGGGASLRSIDRASSGKRDMAMTADYRVVLNRMRKGQPVTCAEPSPDIARIVNATTSVQLTGSAKGIAKVQPELALAFAASRAESMAQLGKRLATIQLLRDSTYRACEAYANGAISEATYAMIVSRYDDVMVTLLLGEIAGGGLGASTSAQLLGSVSRSGLSPEVASAALADAIARTGAAKADFDGAETALDTAKKLPEDDTTRVATIEAKQKARDAAQTKYEERIGQQMTIVAKVGTEQLGGTAPSAAETVQAAQVSGELTGLAKAYLGDINMDAVIVGCLSELSNPAGVVDSTPSHAAGTLRAQCNAMLGNDGQTMKLAVAALLGVDKQTLTDAAGRLLSGSSINQQVDARSSLPELAARPDLVPARP